MASNQPGKPNKRLEARGKAVARKYMITRRDGAAVILTLPVNYKFKTPNRIDRERGVPYAEVSGFDSMDPIDPMAEELEAAQAACAYAIREAVIPANLAKWTAAEAKKRGGNKLLAKALIEHEPDTAHAKTDERNMVRKLEEWRQGKYSAPSGRNRRRVAAYIIFRASLLSIGVTGHWWLKTGEREPLEGPIFRRFNTQSDEERDRRDTYAALMDPVGATFLEAVDLAADRQIKAYNAFLEIVNGCHVEVEP